MSPVPVVVFSDFTCPFSYVTEVALRHRAVESQVAVTYRAFELAPAPAPLPVPEVPGSWEESLRPLADAVGLRVHAQPFQPRTRKAHEAAMFAGEHGQGDAMRAVIFRAFWEEGHDIGRVDVLVELAVEVGLNRAEAKIALDIDRYTDAVFADGAAALRLGITGVPTLLVGTGPGARMLIGAQSPEELGAAIAEAAKAESGG